MSKPVTVRIPLPVVILIILLVAVVAWLALSPRSSVGGGRHAPAWSEISHNFQQLSAADWASYKNSRVLGTRAENWSGAVMVNSNFPMPAGTFVVDMDGDGVLDIAVATDSRRSDIANSQRRVSFSGQIVSASDDKGGLMLIVQEDGAATPTK